MHAAATAEAGKLDDQWSGDAFVVLTALLDLYKTVNVRFADSG